MRPMPLTRLRTVAGHGKSVLVPLRLLHGCWDSADLTSASRGGPVVPRPPRVAAHLCLLFSCSKIIRKILNTVKDNITLDIRRQPWYYKYEQLFNCLFLKGDQP